jgi:hypothetical protein
MKRFWIIIAACFLIACFEVTKAASSKIDTVYFQHGDRITGELLSLNKGILKLKTNDGGTINIEWKNIDSLCILNPLRIIKHNGGIFYGRLYPSGKRGVCILLDEEGKKNEIELQSVVELIKLEKRVFDRISGTLSSGFSFIKATEVTQFDFAGNVDYKGEKTILSANYNLVLTGEGREITQRQTGGASFDRVLPKNWSVKGMLMAESNSEFQLDLRTSLISGLSYNFIRSNSQRLNAGAGLSINREFSGDLSQNNFEGLAGLTYSLFIIESPEVSFNFSGYLLPGFNHPGRIRSTVNTDMKWEMFKDFFLKWSLFHNFDNEPLSGVDIRTDWGTSLGLEFKF